LNIGRGFPGLDKSLSFLKSQPWDIACLQDVRETHVPMIAKIFPGAQYFVPMSRHLIDGVRVPVGIGIFSRNLPFLTVSAHAYVGDVLPVHDLEGVEIGHDGASAPHDLEKVRATESRLVIFAVVEVNGFRFRIGTTHGVWVPEGKPDDHQRRCMKKFSSIVYNEYPSIIAGDLNAARGGEIYDKIFSSARLHDCVPSEISNTVDWVNRGKSGPDLVVDYFLTSGLVYDVSSVEAHFGVSDHAALTAEVCIAD